MLSYIQSISIPVNDADDALDFYTNVLDMEVIQDVAMDDEGTRWIEIAPPGAQTHIVLSTTAGPGDIFEPGGFTGFIFATDDIEATLQQFQERGVNVTVPLSDEPWGRWAQFADRDGNEFGLWAPPM